MPLSFHVFFLAILVNNLAQCFLVLYLSHYFLFSDPHLVMSNDSLIIVVDEKELVVEMYVYSQR